MARAARRGVTGRVMADALGSRAFLRSARWRELKDAGVWVIGTSDEASATLYETKLDGPVALVMGAEGEGMRRLTRDTCDDVMSIPMAGSVESLNVSVASGVCLYEAVRQRRVKG